MACRKMYLGLKERPCLASKLASTLPQFSTFLMDGMIIVLDTANVSRFYGLQDNYLGLKERPCLTSKLASAFSNFQPV